MTARDVLDAIEQRADAATPGPWKSYVEGRDHLAGDDFIKDGRGEDIYIHQPTEGGFGWLSARSATQDFIAHARQDVPSLVAALRAVLDMHQQSAVYPAYCHCEMPWPCVEYRAITDALGGGA